MHISLKLIPILFLSLIKRIWDGLIFLPVVIGIVISFDEQFAVIDDSNFSRMHFEYNSLLCTHIFDNMLSVVSGVYRFVFIYPSIYKAKNTRNLSPKKQLFSFL